MTSETNVAATPAAPAAPEVSTDSAAPAGSDDSLRADLERSYDALDAAQGDAATTPGTAAAPSDSEKPSTTESRTTEATTGKPADLPAIDFPKSWSDDVKQHWGSTPRAVQEMILKREGEVHRAITRLGEEYKLTRAESQEIDAAFEPYKDWVESVGLPRSQIVGQLVAAQTMLDQDPISGLEAIAASYGINLSELSNPNAAERPRVDPTIQQLRTEVNGLRGLLSDQVKGQQETREKALAAEVFSWANESDKAGSRVRPHVEKVWPDMKPLVAELRTQKPNASNSEILAEAYERAIWGNPAVRAELVRAEMERVTAEETKKVQRARGVASSIRGAPGAPPPPGLAGGSLRAQLEAAWDAHAGS